jgi:hypothetical protein
MKLTTVLSSLCLTMLFGSVLVACSTKESHPPIEIDKDYLNQQITLKAPSFSNTFRTAEAISIDITNKSPYEIVFPNDYNIKIFSYSDNEWVKIPEIPTTRLPAGDFVLAPNSNMLTIETTFVNPDLPDLKRKYNLRIYVFGDMKAKGESIEVAAFTDVTLRP